MSFNSPSEIKKINLYFKRFMLITRHGVPENSLDIITETLNDKDLAFDNDWNLLMDLVSVIESKFSVRQAVFSHNYFRFEFENHDKIQDKGPDLIEAVYSCCYKALSIYWKEYKAPNFNRGVEPFDEND